MKTVRFNKYTEPVPPTTPTPLEVVVALPPMWKALSLLWAIDAVLFTLADFSSDDGNAATYISIILAVCLVVVSLIALIECTDTFVRSLRRAKAGRITRWRGSQVIALPQGNQVHVHSLHRKGAFAAPDHTCEVFHADHDQEIEAAYAYVAAQRERFAFQKQDRSTPEARALAKVLNG